ncbi:MAG TPA: DUF2059 domain-containing protein [Steroidobacteraceae bacterium]|jgi:hypothetical protein
MPAHHPVLAFALAAATLVTASLPAQEARPTEASVRAVLAAAHLQTTVDSYSTQVEASMRAAVQHELAGQPLNAEQRTIMNRMQDSMVALMREELDWQRMEPQIIELYRNTFTQAEVNGMLKWYTSPTGKAVIAKQPLVTRQMADYAQERVQDVVPRLMQLQKETIAQLKAATSPPEDGGH